MKLQILGCGTSTGVPLPGCRCPVCTSTEPRNARSRSSSVIRLDNGQNILIDTSTDLRWQALTHDVRNVNAVLFTHAHADHILGVEDLRSFNFLQKSAIPCYGMKTTLDELKRFYWYIFNPDTAYEGGALARLELHEISPFADLNLLGIRIQPFQLFHGKTEVLGFRIGSVAYATDCNQIPERSLEVLRGVRFLVLDGLRFEGHRTHFTIPQAIDMATIIGAEKTYLTHMTHSVDYGETSAKLPAHVELAYDGLEIEINV